MSLQVIGTGLGRTGTLPLQVALERLGFAPCEHMINLFTDEAPSPAGDRTFWIESGLDTHFDWTNGEIVFRQEAIEGALTPEQLIAQLEEYTGITVHAADAST